MGRVNLDLLKIDLQVRVRKRRIHHSDRNKEVAHEADERIKESQRRYDDAFIAR